MCQGSIEHVMPNFVCKLKDGMLRTAFGLTPPEYCESLKWGAVAGPGFDLTGAWTLLTKG